MSENLFDDCLCHANETFPNPPYQEALFGMNSHSTPQLANSCFNEGDWNSCLSEFAAERYVDVLSNIILLGSDFQLVKWWNAWMKVSSVRSVTTLRCMALEAVQVNRQL